MAFNRPIIVVSIFQSCSENGEALNEVKFYKLNQISQILFV